MKKLMGMTFALMIATAGASKAESDAWFDQQFKSGAAKDTAVHRAAKVVKEVFRGSSDGIASYYWQPQRVASGGWFNPNAMTAAHKTLPFGTRVRVTNQRNGKSVVVTINDRGPYVAGRVIDLSKAAAAEIGMINSGLAPVKVEVM